MMQQPTDSLSAEATGVDLIPVFQRWRAPMTKEDVDKMKAKYPIEETLKRIILSKQENGADE